MADFLEAPLVFWGKWGHSQWPPQNDPKVKVGESQIHVGISPNMIYLIGGFKHYLFSIIYGMSSH